ncbi:MAG: hypothetical protein FWE21_06390 [Defluviitaleaceae bacterium]|nr:hypothetical protein [Defluviitaleaceae bacterium]
MRGAKIVAVDLFMSTEEGERQKNIKKIIVKHLVKEGYGIVGGASKNHPKKLGNTGSAK